MFALLVTVATLDLKPRLLRKQLDLGVPNRCGNLLLLEQC